MPFEIMVVIVVSIVVGMLGLVAITKMIVNAVDRRRITASEDNSMSRSELMGLITAAVLDAMQPLEDKIERLERQLPPRMRPGYWEGTQTATVIREKLDSAHPIVRWDRYGSRSPAPVASWCLSRRPILCIRAFDNYAVVA